MKTLGIVNLSSPMANNQGRESLDLALVAATFEQEVLLLFAEDGVFQLLKDTHPEHAGMKNFTPTLKALEFYDIEKIYVCKASLEARHIQPDLLAIEVELVDRESLPHLMQQAHHWIRF